MVANQKVTGRAWSMPAGIGMGLGISAAFTVGGCALIAWLIQGETLGPEAVGYGAMAVLLAASFLGAATAILLIRRRRLFAALLHGSIYFLLLLLINGMFFGGGIAGAGVTVLVILAGCLCAVMLPSGEKRGNGIRRKIRPSG